jgi:two-component system OmpR family response regulator
VATALAAEQFVDSQDVDLIVMDLGLPDLDGLQLLRRFRHRKLSVPIIILTARDSVDDRIEGIEQGADDYLTKPFELRELEARIQALIRRCYGGFDQHIRIGRLTLDTLQQTFLVDGKPFFLSAREYGVLEILMMQAGKVVAKDRIALRLSNDGEGLSDNAIEINIHRLRKHLETYGVVIRTVRGLGYLLECVDG